MSDTRGDASMFNERQGNDDVDFNGHQFGIAQVDVIALCTRLAAT